MTTERRTVAYVGLIFLSGLLLGGTLMNVAEHYWLHAHAANETDISRHEAIAREMGSRLDLSTDQRQRVDAMLQETLREYQDLERQLEPQFDDVRSREREKLREILNDHQRLEFDKIVADVDAEYPSNERPEALPSPHN